MNIIYARVSTDGTNQDYTRQITDLEGVILSHGYNKESIKIFTDKISGYMKNEDRAGMTQLLEFISKNPNSIIYVTEISRLGRNPSETRKTVDALTEMRIPVYIQSLGRATLDKDGKRDSLVNIILQILMEFSHSEAEQMKFRIKSGKRAAAKKGKHSTNVYAYGYSKGEDGVMVIEESEAEIVKRIFLEYSKGFGIRAIATMLNAENIPTKFNLIYDAERVIGGKMKAKNYTWTIATVDGILKNTSYKGLKKHVDEFNACPAIVSEDLWETCMTIRTTKTNRNYMTTYTYLLRELMVCGTCGRNYYGKYKATDKGDRVYMCSSKITNTPCGQSSVNISYIETAIFESIISNRELLAIFSSLTDFKHELQGEVDLLRQELPSIKKQLTNFVKKRQTLVDLLVDGLITKAEAEERNVEIAKGVESYTKKVSLIEKELKEKEKAISSIGNEKLIDDILTKAATNRTELAAIFKQLINKVYIKEIDNKYFYLSISLQMGTKTVLPTSMIIILDKSSLRFNPRFYSRFGVVANKLKEVGPLEYIQPQDLIESFNRDPERWRKMDKKKFLQMEMA